MRRHKHFVIPILCALTGTLAAHAADLPLAPKPDAACAGCHGSGGRQPLQPDTPRLAGQKYDYLVEALRQYRTGARQDPIMGAMAKSLSEADVRNLARYFAAEPGLTMKY
jgi:cytochrome c553